MRLYPVIMQLQDGLGINNSTEAQQGTGMADLEVDKGIEQCVLTPLWKLHKKSKKITAPASNIGALTLGACMQPTDEHH